MSKRQTERGAAVNVFCVLISQATPVREHLCIELQLNKHCSANVLKGVYGHTGQNMLFLCLVSSCCSIIAVS